MFNEGAGHNDARAQFALGLMYENGEGLTADLAQALEWYTKSADQGYAKAHYQLGLLYLKGRGVKRDDSRAGEWFARAAEGGNPDAVARYRQFAEDGDIEAQYHLALMTLRGSGVAWRAIRRLPRVGCNVPLGAGT